MASATLRHNELVQGTRREPRKSLKLPASTAAKVRRLARRRNVTADRMLLELVQNGIATETQREREFFSLAQSFRDERDPEAAQRLGDQLGEMIFGD